MNNYKIVNLDRDWDSKLITFKNWNIFQTSTWVKIYQKIYFPKANIEGLLFYENDTLIGMLPLIYLKKFLIKIAGSPLRHALTPFIGFAFKEGKFYDCFTMLLEYINLNKVNIFSITQNEILNLDMKNNTKNDPIQLYTYTTSVINLQLSEDELWKNLNQKTRNQIRKGEKYNLLILDSHSNDVIKNYLTLRSKMYKKQKINFEISNKFLSEILNKIPNHNFKIFSIYYEDNLIASAIFLLFNGICYYWDGVSDQEYNKLCPNNVIQWAAIKWAKNNGYFFYDFGGTNIPSIAHFKQGYGGMTKEYVSFQIFKPSILSKVWNYKKNKVIINNPRLKAKN